MSQRPCLRGTVIQAGNPDWRPLERAVGAELARRFMWMYEVRLDDGTRVDAYKHVMTRRYLHLGADGIALRHGLDGRYRAIALESAIQAAFDGFQSQGVGPHDAPLLAAALASARGLAA